MTQLRLLRNLCCKVKKSPILFNKIDKNFLDGPTKQLKVSLLISRSLYNLMIRTTSVLPSKLPNLAMKTTLSGNRNAPVTWPPTNTSHCPTFSPLYDAHIARPCVRCSPSAPAYLPVPCNPGFYPARLCFSGSKLCASPVSCYTLTRVLQRCVPTLLWSLRSALAWKWSLGSFVYTQTSSKDIWKHLGKGAPCTSLCLLLWKDDLDFGSERRKFWKMER